jgi:hypothetical protein
MRCGVDLAGGEVENSAAADGGELMAVAEQRQANPALVGDGQQRPRGVLVEHPGLVDGEQVARVQSCGLPGAGVGDFGDRVGLADGQPGPGAVAAPAPAVLGLLRDPDSTLEAEPITLDVAAAFRQVPRDALGDPWDRFITATAMALGPPLVTRDRRITELQLVETIW